MNNEYKNTDPPGMHHPECWQHIVRDGECYTCEMYKAGAASRQAEIDELRAKLIKAESGVRAIYESLEECAKNYYAATERAEVAKKALAIAVEALKACNERFEFENPASTALAAIADATKGGGYDTKY